MLIYPRASESVAYNVPINGLLAGSNLDTLPRQNSRDALRPVRNSEASRVHKYAYKAICKHVSALRLPALTELRARTWSLDDMGDPLGDRTLPVVFENYPMIDEAFVTFVQSDILMRFPHWRVLHCEDGDRPDLNLAIYPDAVSVGNSLPSNDAGSALTVWREGITRFREPRSGPLRRQLKFVQSAITKIPPSRWRSWAPTVIGAFDTYEGDESFQTAWLMVQGESPFNDEIDGAEVGDGNYYPVRRNGQIGEVLALRSSTGLWIRQVVFPKQESPRVLIARRNQKLISRIQIQDFVRDSDLDDPSPLQ